MIGGALNNAMNLVVNQTETFANPMVGGYVGTSSRAAIISLITVLIVFALILFLGKWLWNNVLVTLVPAIRPAKSVWQILGIALLISLMNPGC